MGNTIAELEKSVREKPKASMPNMVVMDDALIGTVKKSHRPSTKPTYRLYLAILGAVAALVAAPITYTLSFSMTHATNAVTLRLALLSPVVFFALGLVIFGVFWIMQKWFSLWFIFLVAAAIFVGSLISIAIH